MRGTGHITRAGVGGFAYKILMGISETPRVLMEYQSWDCQIMFMRHNVAERYIESGRLV